MSKPLHKVAMLLWILAIACAVMNFADLWTAYKSLQAVRPMAGETFAIWSPTMTRSLSAICLQFGLLGGTGTLIEIADRILWQLKNKQD